MCGLSRLVNKPNCVVYSAGAWAPTLGLRGTPNSSCGVLRIALGISTESSFEAELVKRTKCQVFGFDFSVDKACRSLAQNKGLWANWIRVVWS